MLLDSFLIFFRQFHFLTSSNDFAKAIPLGMEAILANNQNTFVSQILGVFSTIFCIE